MTKQKKKTLKRTGKNFPKDCAHINFFWCKSASECFGCYYNPIKEEALKNRDKFQGEYKKTTKHDWFYGGPKKEIKEILQLLDDIRKGRGLFKNGRRFKWRFDSNLKSDNEED